MLKKIHNMNVLSFDVGLKNLAYCVLTPECNIVNWGVCSLPTVHVKNIVEFLDDMHLFHENIDTVIIEKQPARNVKMRLIESILHVYFVMKNVKKVNTYSSKHKLGALGKTVKGKSNYSLRKKMSVAMTTRFLDDNKSFWKEIFEKSKKKDDLADSLLQGLSYLKYDTEHLQQSIVTIIN